MQRIYESRFFPPILCALYLVPLGITFYIIAYYPKAEIEMILTRLIPWSLRINFLLLLVGIIHNLRDIMGVFRKLFTGDRLSKGLLLIALLVFALVCVSLMTTRTHRLYYDEDIYASIGQNIAYTGQTGMCNYGTFEYGEYYAHWLSYNKDPSGWPFLISLVFQLLGTNEIYAFLLNNLIFTASVLVVFFITWTVTGSYFPSFLAALVFALIPHNLIWHNTAAAEPSAALFAGLVVLCLTVYLRTGKSLFLLATVLPLACQMRPESALIVPWVVMTAMVCSTAYLPGQEKGKRTVILRKEVWMMGLLATILLLPHILHLYTVSGLSWGAEGSKFSLIFLGKNFATNGLYYLNNRHFPVLFTSLSVIGLFSFRQVSFRFRLMILTWFLLFWGVFLFFYAGSYQYGADVRFALLSFMPLSILAGKGGGSLGDRIRQMGYGKTGVLFIAILVFAWMRFLPLVRLEGQEAWGARYDHYHAREFIKKIPRRSIVLTHIPTMFLLWQQNAIQTYAGINNPDLVSHLMERYQGHVYFHYNYWCNITVDPSQKICQAIMDKYDLKEIASATEQSYHYGLYRIRSKSP